MTRTGYIGQVIDRMEGKVVHQTRPRPTWEDAQRAAERGGKRKLTRAVFAGDRYRVCVT